MKGGKREGVLTQERGGDHQGEADPHQGKGGGCRQEGDLGPGSRDGQPQGGQCRGRT